MKEVFNGFISLDGKFWKTLIPLLTKPGRVSRNFIDGKRARYSNPFQFYLSISIVFFLILGIADKYQDFQDLRTGRKSKGANIVDIQENASKALDSIVTEGNLNEQLKKLDSSDRETVLALIPKNIKDSTNTSKSNNAFNFDGGPSVNRIVKYQKEHPEIPMDDALDSLKITKSFFNRFMYTKAEKINSFMTNTNEENKKFSRELVSYASISIFIFLPIFTLFLRFIYIRRKFTYVEHLIFVFHTQTVFFIILTIFFLLNLTTGNQNITWIFILLFLLYLLIAMKKFYQQGYFKTFIKFCILNFAFMILASIGFMIVSVITFAMY